MSRFWKWKLGWRTDHSASAVTTSDPFPMNETVVRFLKEMEIDYSHDGPPHELTFMPDFPTSSPRVLLLSLQASLLSF